jgi:hypothetical protein
MEKYFFRGKQFSQVLKSETYGKVFFLWKKVEHFEMENIRNVLSFSVQFFLFSFTENFMRF